MLSTQLCRTDRGTRARAPLTLGSSPACGQQQRRQQRQRWRARPAAARPVHSSSRGGASGSLAARRTSTGSPWAPGHLVLPSGTRWTQKGLRKALCPSDLLPRLCSAASDPGARLLPVLRSSPASASRSLSGCPGRSSAPCVSLAPTPGERARCLGLRSLGSRGGAAPPALFDCSSRPTCHFPLTLQPCVPAWTNGRGEPSPGS